MMNRSTIASTAAALAIMGAAYSADTAAQKLQQRFKSRYRQLLQYKNEGKLGERPDGMVEATKTNSTKDKKLKGFIAEENADRTALFTLMAKQSKAPVALVAKRFYLRALERAEPTHLFKDDTGAWKQRKDIKVKKR